MNNTKYWNSFLPVFLDRIGNVMRGNMTSLVEEYGISSAHCTYLITLYLLDGPTSAQLSKYLDMDQGNTFRVVQQLIDKGMVRTDKTTEKSRNYRLYLTEYGEEIAIKVMNGTNEFMDTGFAGVSDEDVLTTRRVLVQILQNLDPSLEDYLDNSFTNPFFSYLNMMIPNEKDVLLVPKHLRKDSVVKYEPVRISEKGSQAPVFPSPEKIVDETKALTVLVTDADDGGFQFLIYQDTKKCLYSSQTFETKVSCNDCVKAIIANSSSHIRDMTLQNPPLALGSVYEINRAKSGKYFYRLLDESKNELMVSKEYSNKTICKRDIERFRINLPFAKIVEY